MRAGNWHKLVIPCILILHSFLNIVYYRSWFFEWSTRGWACYFHCVQQLVIALWLLVFFYAVRKTYFDKQFISIAILYNIFLAGCYVYRQNTGDKETSHLFGVGASI